MKLFFIGITFFISSLGYTSVVKSFDNEKDCTLYRVPNETSPTLEGEVVITDKDAYGLTIVDMDINFSNKTVSVSPMINIVLGANRNLINGRAVIKSTNDDFKFLINQLNRKLYVFEKMCINSENEIIYAKQFETTN